MSTIDTINSGRTHGLGDTLNVVTQDLPVTLSTPLAETLQIVPKHSELCGSEPDSKLHTLPPLPRPDMFHECYKG